MLCTRKALYELRLSQTMRSELEAALRKSADFRRNRPEHAAGVGVRMITANPETLRLDAFPVGCDQAEKDGGLVQRHDAAKDAVSRGGPPRHEGSDVPAFPEPELGYTQLDESSASRWFECAAVSQICFMQPHD